MGPSRRVTDFELAELRDFGRDSRGGRALGDFVGGRPGDSLDRIVERVVQLVAQGRVRFDRRPFHYAGSGGEQDAAEVQPDDEGASEVSERHELLIEVVGEDDLPIAGVAYRVELPDGDIRQGRVGSDGRAALRGLPDAGACKVCLPELDQDAWEYVEAKPM